MGIGYKRQQRFLEPEDLPPPTSEGCPVDCSLADNIINGTCLGGGCVFECAENYANCNHNPFSGCLQHLPTDPRHCHTCGTNCYNYPRIDVASCNPSLGCMIDSCLEPYLDCDSIVENGCETNGYTNNSNCGACGHSCAAITIDGTALNYSCIAGVCAVTKCQTNYKDCNGDPSDQCECGPQAHSLNATCNSTACKVGSCVGGWGDCDGDYSNGCETNLNTSTSSCGLCSYNCNSHKTVYVATTTCVGGNCKVFTCNTTGYYDCNQVWSDGCECRPVHNALSTQCTLGVCSVRQCRNDTFDCNGLPSDGCECKKPVDAEQLYIGNVTCRGGACAVGVCSNVFVRDCNGLLSDGCECQPQNYVDVAGMGCNGTECIIDLCAWAGRDCNGDISDGCECQSANYPHVYSVSCDGPDCIIGSCVPGWDDCDGDILNGCELDTSSDSNNCGGCNRTCVSVLTIAGGDTFDDVHVSNVTCFTDTDVSDFGGFGECRFVCSSGWGNCDSVSDNGCEIDLIDNDQFCGSCTRNCTFFGTTCEVDQCCIDPSASRFCDGFSCCDGSRCDSYCNPTSGTECICCKTNGMECLDPSLFHTSLACCSGYCVDNACACKPEGFGCSGSYANTSCCTGYCNSATHLCKCLPSNQICTSNIQCCTRDCTEGSCAACRTNNTVCSVDQNCCSPLGCVNGTCGLRPLGGNCTVNATCLSGRCAGGLCVCQIDNGHCSNPGGLDSNCCHGYCEANSTCSCRPPNIACVTNSSCCSESCVGGECCVDARGDCTSDAQCCETSCVGGLCCNDLGEACFFNNDCCSENCDLGNCTCDAVEQFCTSNHTCCSNECKDGHCCGHARDECLNADYGPTCCDPLDSCAGADPEEAYLCCRTTGVVCSSNSQCCTSVCNTGLCT